MSDSRLRGIIIRMRRDKGYAFITGPASVATIEYFFHMQDCVPGVEFKELGEGSAVVFLPEKTEKGWRARNVSLP